MYTKLLEWVNDNDFIVYHGSYKEHKFDSTGELFGGTFFSTRKAEAATYGKFLYEVELYRELNILDTNKIADCRKIFQEFDYLEDDESYYNEDGFNDEGEEYIVTSPEKLYSHADNWYMIEHTPGLIRWIQENYDGVWIYEGGGRNLLLFAPVLDKIKEIVKLR